MKYCYYNKNGELIYGDIEGKIDMVVFPKPLPTLVIAKNPLNIKTWIVFEYETGILLANFFLKKERCKRIYYRNFSRKNI